MSLGVGARLGHYSVTAKLGEGGMGEVWEATDTELNRQVALKILPEAFAADPDRLARFQREAQVLASLNHPNIAQIHGVELADGTRTLVLELVEGPTLADRIAQGPLPIDEALSIAKQIAEALEAAHEAGVIHRDLKPANIKVRADGTVKVLDFGLAKALDISSEGDPSQSPTLTAAATASGVIMGTAAYMSPEQARGKPVDRRTDVWAFGCVLYEMLTGRRAFAAEAVPDTVVAVLTGEVDLDALPRDVPAAGRRLLRRCFEKELRQRLRDAVDGLLLLEEELKGRSDTASTSSVAATARPRARRRSALPWVAGIAFAICITGVVVWNLRPAPAPLTRDAFAITFPADVRLTNIERFAALSPDGRTLVYVGERDGTRQLYRRPLDQVDATLIPDTVGAINPFFSPDGEWVAFVVEDRIMKVSMSGGSSVIVATGSAALGDADDGLFWSDDDTIWTGGGRDGYYHVPAAGGVPQFVEMLSEVSGGVMGVPQPLPGGRGVLYARARSMFESDAVTVYIPETGEHRELTDGFEPWFAPSGHVVFSRGADLWALPFDVNRLEAMGEPVLVLEGVRGRGRGGIGAGDRPANQAFVGRDGTLVYVPGSGRANDRRLVWVDREEYEEPIDALPRPYRVPRVSPDGTRVAYRVDDDIFVYDLARGTETRLTSDPASDVSPLWTPDGRRVVFGSDRDREVAGEFDLFWAAADGTGQVELFHGDRDRNTFASSWSNDGQTLVAHATHRTEDTAFDIGTIALEGERRWVGLLQQYNEFYGEVSPDGRWLAYVSNESGQRGIQLQPFPNVDEGKWPVGIGTDPVWSPNGRELFYRRDRRGVGQRAMMVAPIDGQGPSPVGVSEWVFEDTYFASGFGRNYDIAPDGRFLMLSYADSEPARQINVIRHWVEELRERVPVD